MLEPRKCCLVIVDVQGKLAHLMHERDALFKNLRILIQAARLLGVPILWCQQCPESLGPTVEEVSGLLADETAINKSSFSCWHSAEFGNKLSALARRQVVLAGIEAHVCIYQTAIDLLGKDYEVHVIADAVSSRTAANKQIALDRMRAEGVKISSTEMALFELLKTAEHARFKEVANLVK
jgi:nicotinamidase-related amidase